MANRGGAISAIVAGLGRGAESLGASMSERDKAKRALEQLVQMQTMRDASESVWGNPIPGEDENGPGLFQTNRRTGEIRRAQVSGGAPPAVAADPTSPTTGPSGPSAAIRALIGGPAGDIGTETPAVPSDTIPPVPAPRGLRPIARAAPASATRKVKVVQPDGSVVFVDPNNPPEGLKERSAAPALVETLVPDGQGGTKTVLAPKVAGQEVAGSGGKLTEPQEKSYLFYNLMKNAQPTIDATMRSGKIRKGMVTAYLEAGPASSLVNRALNADEQKLIRSFRDFAAGVLRKESGAAVTDDELREVWGRYGPTFGDDPSLDEAKSQARLEYMSTMKQQASSAIEFYRRKTPGKGSAGAAPSATREQALWDAAVAKHGEAKVLKEVGPRP